MIAPVSTGAGRGLAVENSVLHDGTSGFDENLRRAASGGVDAKNRMGSALRTATLSDRRHCKPFDLELSWQRYYADRASERALTALSWCRQHYEEREAKGRVRCAA
jgi:hypothetical protein